MLARHDRSALVLFLFIVCVFSALAYRGERQDHQLMELNYTMCTGRNLNVARLNAFNRGMITIERHNPYAATSPQTVARRIELYRGALLAPAKCGKDPR